jgi:ISXO2 transposase-like protein
MTDESNTYSDLGKHFKSHDVVDHSRKEYAYTDRVRNLSISINSAEGFYSVFKRGMIGVYQHWPRSIFTAMSPSSISAIQTARRSASRIWSALKSWRLALSEGD